MAEHWVCRYCMMAEGLRGSELENWPLIGDDEGIAKHIESMHHIPVRRDQESDDEANARFSREQPEAGGANCKCPACGLRRVGSGE